MQIMGDHLVRRRRPQACPAGAEGAVHEKMTASLQPWCTTRSRQRRPRRPAPPLPNGREMRRCCPSATAPRGGRGRWRPAAPPARPTRARGRSRGWS
ncbi:hypothetical protein ACHAXT_001973 [Thalassiosira profunda]